MKMLPISLGLFLIASCHLVESQSQAKPVQESHIVETRNPHIYFHVRDKRTANPIIVAGRVISRARKLIGENKLTTVYQKPGNKNRARKDFYLLQPDQVQMYSFPYGGTGLKGRVGSRIVFYRSRDIAEDSKPTLEISRPGRIDPETKIIYQTKETIYSPNFDKN